MFGLGPPKQALQSSPSTQAGNNPRANKTPKGLSNDMKGGETSSMAVARSLIVLCSSPNPKGRLLRKTATEQQFLRKSESCLDEKLESTKKDAPVKGPVKALAKSSAKSPAKSPVEAPTSSPAKEGEEGEQGEQEEAEEEGEDEDIRRESEAGEGDDDDSDDDEDGSPPDLKGIDGYWC